MKNYSSKNSTRPWIVAGIVIAVIVFIGWWGVNLNKDQSNQTASVSGVIGSKAGNIAPDFTLPATTGGSITLSDFRSKKNVLLYFNEGLSCQPCWEQIPEVEKYFEEFEKMNVELVTVALDPVDQWKETIDHYKIRTPVLSYESARTEYDYDLLRYSMGMGRRAGHTFILVGTDGKILWRKDYWPSRGHMVAGGTMFVEGQYIAQAVKEHLAQQ
jgi:peroxiredoxin Q/BCP